MKRKIKFQTHQISCMADFLNKTQPNYQQVKKASNLLTSPKTSTLTDTDHQHQSKQNNSMLFTITIKRYHLGRKQKNPYQKLLHQTCMQSATSNGTTKRKQRNGLTNISMSDVLMEVILTTPPSQLMRRSSILLRTKLEGCKWTKANKKFKISESFTAV